MAWDLAPHDISIILHILGELPLVVNCQGNAHVTPGIEDVTNISSPSGTSDLPRSRAVGLSPGKFVK